SACRKSRVRGLWTKRRRLLIERVRRVNIAGSLQSETEQIKSRSGSMQSCPTARRGSLLARRVPRLQRLARGQIRVNSWPASSFAGLFHLAIVVVLIQCVPCIVLNRPHTLHQGARY